jgi:hypothetical protein
MELREPTTGLQGGGHKVVQQWRAEMWCLVLDGARVLRRWWVVVEVLLTFPPALLVRLGAF